MTENVWVHSVCFPWYKPGIQLLERNEKRASNPEHWLDDHEKIAAICNKFYHTVRKGKSDHVSDAQAEDLQ